MSSKPSYKKILHDIQEAIASGALAPGERLPSERDLAERLGVHRSTVARAMQALVDRGLVERRIGSGTFITNRKWTICLPEERNALDTEPTPLARWYERRVREALAAAPAAPWQHLESGDAPPSWMPRGEDLVFSWEMLSEEGRANEPMGLYSLRLAVANHLADAYGMHIDPSEILITSGTRQSLFLITHAYLKPGDHIALEAPSYFYSLRLFRAAGIRPQSIPMDRGGLSLTHLEAAIMQAKPAMLFCNPIFQNPTGLWTTPERREALRQLCSTYRIPLFEDDASALLPYAPATDIRPIKALDDRQQILYAGSISKYIGPQLRLGWLVGPAKLMRALADVRQSMDAGLSLLPQLMMRNFLAGELDLQITKMQSALKARLDPLTALMAEIAPDLAPLARDGGFYLYYPLQEGKQKTARALLDRLLERYLIVDLGSRYHDPQGGLRLNLAAFEAESDRAEH